MSSNFEIIFVTYASSGEKRENQIKIKIRMMKFAMVSSYFPVPMKYSMLPQIYRMWKMCRILHGSSTKVYSRKIYASIFYPPSQRVGVVAKTKQQQYIPPLQQCAILNFSLQVSVGPKQFCILTCLCMVSLSMGGYQFPD